MKDTQVELVLIAPEVMDASVMRQPVDEPHLHWLVGYAPEAGPEDNTRVVFGTVHAASEFGFGEVTVACMMKCPEQSALTADQFKAVLSESDALETLYDIARVAFRAVTAVTEVDVELPHKAPVPDMSELVRSPADEGEADPNAKED
ncbi:MAG: hypothetical protein CVT61_00260 [Actinobacteria bacterium HGW-Actinobacteria-11]|nr:MAG: hypothetical protein CVT61_00260 [Actinobacteria bacterium HGW-Actinobacteria-11]